MIVLAHGGTAGAVAESIFLGVPVVVFMLLSRWAKRKARKLEAEAETGGGRTGGGRADGDQGEEDAE